MKTKLIATNSGNKSKIKKLLKPVKYFLQDHPNIYAGVITGYNIYRHRRALLNGSVSFNRLNGLNWIAYLSPTNMPDPAGIKKVTMVPSRGVGDLLVMTPSARYLKYVRPDIFTEIIIPEAYYPLIKDNPFINNIITIGKDNRQKDDLFFSFKTALANRQKENPSDLFLLQGKIPGLAESLENSDINHHPFHLTMSAMQSGKEDINSGIGLSTISTSTLFRKRMYASEYLMLDPLLAFFGNKKESRVFLSNQQWRYPYLSPSLFLPQKVKEAQRAFIEQADCDPELFNKPLVLINLLTSVIAKMLPDQDAIKLIRKMAKEHPETNFIINTGIKSAINNHPEGLTEFDYINQKIKPYIEDLPNIVFSPSLSLEQFTQAISSVNYYFSMDTGIPHIFASNQLNHIPGFVIHHNNLSTCWGIKADHVQMHVPKLHASNSWSDPRHLQMKSPDKTLEAAIEHLDKHLNNHKK